MLVPDLRVLQWRLRGRKFAPERRQSRAERRINEGDGRALEDPRDGLYEKRGGVFRLVIQPLQPLTVRTVSRPLLFTPSGFKATPA